MIAIYFALGIAYVCTFCCMKRVHKRLGTLLIWNGLIRVFMELYLELALLSLHNVTNLEWPSNSPLYLASNILAIFFLGLVCVIPIVLVVIYF